MQWLFFVVAASGCTAPARPAQTDHVRLASAVPVADVGGASGRGPSRGGSAAQSGSEPERGNGNGHGSGNTNENGSGFRSSKPLPNGFFNPLPGGVMAGYRADTGLDIASPPRPVFAIAAGKLDYAEAGHTLWVGPRDGPYTVRVELDAPIPHEGRLITHVWYAHLSELRIHQAEGSTPRARIAAGQELGVSGSARGSPHLHLGLLLDGDVSQSWGTFLLEDEVRAVLGGWRRGARLPAE